MANPFDIAEGKVSPFDIAEKSLNPFDVAEAQYVAPSAKVQEAQKLKGTPVAPGMPTSVAEVGPKQTTAEAMMDIGKGVFEAPVELGSGMLQFGLEATTPVKYLENMLFGQNSSDALRKAQESTSAQQAALEFTPSSKMGEQLPQIPFLPITAAMELVNKGLDVAGGEGAPDAQGNLPIRQQAAKGIKQGLNSALAALMIRGAAQRGKRGPIEEPTRVAEQPKAEPAKPSPFDIAEQTKAELPQGAVPAGSLPYGAELPKRRIYLQPEKFSESYDVKKAIVDTIDMYEKQIQSARGKTTIPDIRAIAENSGFEMQDLLGHKRKPGVKDSARMMALNDVYAAQMEALANAQKKFATEGMNEVTMGEFSRALGLAADATVSIFGERSEAGRTLRVLREAANPEWIKNRNYKAMIDAVGGPEKVAAMADAFAKIDLSNQYQVNRFIREVSKVKTADKVYWVWLNSILSAPASHLANILSNTLTGMTKPIEKGIAGGIDILRSLVTGKEREVFPGEAVHDFFGVRRGIVEGAQAFLKAWQDDMPQMSVSKLEVKPAPLKGRAGRIIGGPTRALMAADEFFKAMIYRSEINSLAYRQAMKEKLKGQARNKRIAQLVAEPEEWMKNRAFEEAKYRTFQKELGPIGTKAMNLRNSSMVMKVLFPFVKTPTNIVKFGLERTPLEFIDAGLKAAKGELKGGAISEQMAKPVLGTLVSGALLTAVMDGNISGAGPVKKGERDALYRTGWQPYSIKIGDKWYSYKRLEPVGMIVGLTADTSEIWRYATAEEKAGLATAISTAVGQNVLNKTWMQGASNALNAITDPERYGQPWVQAVVGSAVPGVVTAAARALDPNMRDAQNIIDGIKMRIPIQSETVLPKLNLWGAPIKKSEGLGEYYIGRVPSRFVSPVQVAPVGDSKVDTEIVRLVREGYMQAPNLPAPRVSGIDLTPEQHQDMVKRGGQLAKQALDKLVKSDQYEKAPDMAKAKIIESVMDSYRTMAAAEMIARIKNEQGADVVGQGMARSRGIIPRTTKPSPEKSLSDMLLNIRRNQ